jgi:hypothetical protein
VKMPSGTRSQLGWAAMAASSEGCIVAQPAKVLAEPAATAVQPEIASPTRPMPLPLTNTVVLPTVIDAECPGHGEPGSRCGVLASP